LSQFTGFFSRPQYKYFVTILLGLMLCQSGRTLSGLLGQVDSGVGLSGASRFMGQAPWPHIGGALLVHVNGTVLVHMGGTFTGAY